jgi:alpha-galactosidase
VPDEWFFMRHGKRVIDNSRLHLDFRNPDVIKHVDSVINRLLKEYEIGYIKMDYNVDYGCGTEVNSNSFGDGLLVHNRAYLKWIDSVYERYPNLVIENCGSGGCRMDYAMLSRHSIQSASDNEDYRKNAFISASAPTAVLPEQCAIWSYPLREGSDEEVAFNMVNAMLMRIHQSGHMAEISKTRKEIVKEGIDYYKTFRELIPKSLPIWPLGLPSYFDSWITAGLEVENKIFLAVWRLENENDNCLVPIHKLNGKNIDVKLGFPREAKCDFKWEKDSGVLIIEMPKNSARILEITIN